MQCIDHGRSGTRGGYAQRMHRGRPRYVHRLVYADAHGLDEATMGGVVMHSCDNPRCINIAHLSLGTQQENVQDCLRKGRHRTNPTRADASGQAKLTWALVDSLRAEYVPGCRAHGARAMARRYGLNQTRVSEVLRNECWVRT